MRHLYWLSFLCSLLLISTIVFSTCGVAFAFSKTTCGGWHVVPSPDPSSAVNTLYSISSVSINDVWAVGDYGPPGGGADTLIEHWDGSQWSVVSSPNPGEGNYLYSVSAISSSEAWAVGYFSPPGGGIYTLIEHWNGSQWSVVSSPNPGEGNYLYGISAISRNNAWAVGHFSHQGGGVYTLIEHWNGSQWSVVPSSNPSPDENYLYGVSAVSRTNVWAAGIQGAISLVEHWDGVQWSVIPSTNPSSYLDYLYAVAAVSSQEVWIVGGYASGNGGTSTLIEKWNGKKWQQVPSPSPGAFANILYGVAALSSSNAWAVGEYLPTSSTEYTLTEHWNGKVWKVTPSPSPGPSHLLRAVAQVPRTSQVWAVGFYTNNNGSQTLVESYC